MAKNDATLLVRLPGELRDRVNEAAAEREESASDFVRTAIEVRLDGLDDVPVKKPVLQKPAPNIPKNIPAPRPMVGRMAREQFERDPRVVLVREAIEKRGRSTVRQIVADTGMVEMAVEKVLKGMSGLSWPQPGVVELAE